MKKNYNILKINNFNKLPENVQAFIKSINSGIYKVSLIYDRSHYADRTKWISSMFDQKVKPYGGAWALDNGKYYAVSYTANTGVSQLLLCCFWPQMPNETVGHWYCNFPKKVAKEAFKLTEIEITQEFTDLFVEALVKHDKRFPSSFLHKTI